jgi:hypothetical protein
LAPRWPILLRGPDRVQSGADSIGGDEGTKVHNRPGALVDALPNEAGAAFEAVASGAFSSAATAGFSSRFLFSLVCGSWQVRQSRTAGGQTGTFVPAASLATNPNYESKGKEGPMINEGTQRRQARIGREIAPGNRGNLPARNCKSLRYPETKP